MKSFKFQATEIEAKAIIDKFKHDYTEVSIVSISTKPLQYEYEILFTERVEETWKDIVGQSQYQVSSLGRTRRLKNPEILRPYRLQDGKLQVTFSTKMNGRSTEDLAKIVCTAFVPNPKNYKFIGYKDGNKSNVDRGNLYWKKKKG